MLLEVHCHVHRSPAPRVHARTNLVASTRSLPLATLLIGAFRADHDRQIARGYSKMDRLVGYTLDARPFVAH